MSIWTELTFCFHDGRAAELFLADVAGEENTFPALGFDQLLRFPRVLVFVQINDRNVRAFLRIEDRDGPADPAVPAGDQCDFVPQFPRPHVIAGT